MVASKVQMSSQNANEGNVAPLDTTSKYDRALALVDEVITYHPNGLEKKNPIL